MQNSSQEHKDRTCCLWKREAEHVTCQPHRAFTQSQTRGHTCPCVRLWSRVPMWSCVCTRVMPKASRPLRNLWRKQKITEACDRNYRLHRCSRKQALPPGVSRREATEGTMIWNPRKHVQISVPTSDPGTVRSAYGSMPRNISDIVDLRDRARAGEAHLHRRGRIL